MTLPGQKKYLDALAHAKGEFAKRSFAKILEISGAVPYDDASLIIPYGGDSYRVWHPEGEVCLWENEGVKGTEKEVEITNHILILHYLTEVCGVQSIGTWISFRELPGGNNHYGSFKQEAIEPLAKRYGNSPEEFERTCQALGGKKLPLGDIAYAIPVFPKLELALILWLADEEFSAQANILYNSNVIL